MLPKATAVHGLALWIAREVSLLRSAPAAPKLTGIKSDRGVGKRMHGVPWATRPSNRCPLPVHLETET